jgi:hypothetical protein
MNDKNIKDIKGTGVHGNTARIDPKKPVTPLFSTIMGEYNTDSQGRRHHRHHDEEEYGEYVRHEVESIRL